MQCDSKTPKNLNPWRWLSLLLLFYIQQKAERSLKQSKKLKKVCSFILTVKVYSWFREFKAISLQEIKSALHFFHGQNGLWANYMYIHRLNPYIGKNYLLRYLFDKIPVQFYSNIYFEVKTWRSNLFWFIVFWDQNMLTQFILIHQGATSWLITAIFQNLSIAGGYCCMDNLKNKISSRPQRERRMARYLHVRFVVFIDFWYPMNFTIL